MNKKSLTQGLLLLTLIVAGLYVYQTNKNVTVPLAMPSGETVTNVDPVGAVDAASQTSDVTPNFDPNDPYGVKFGFSALGFICLVIVLDWALKQGVRAISKKRGGGS